MAHNQLCLANKLVYNDDSDIMFRWPEDKSILNNMFCSNTGISTSVEFAYTEGAYQGFKLTATCTSTSILHPVDIEFKKKPNIDGMLFIQNGNNVDNFCSISKCHLYTGFSPALN